MLLAEEWKIVTHTNASSLLCVNEIVRKGLNLILTDEHFRVTSSVGDARQLNTPLAGPEEERSHIIIIDNGPDHFGADNCRKLQQRFPDAHLVVLADEFQYDEVAEAFRFGVDGYIVQEISCEPLISSLHLVALGDTVMQSPLSRPFSHRDAGFTRHNCRQSIS